MIKIGTSLTLEILEEDRMEKYRCKVIEQSGSFLYVDYPINETTGRTGFFVEDTEFLAHFIGYDNSVYQFATILKSKKKLNIPSLVLDYPGDKDLKRIQRREYVRIDSANDIAIHDPKGEYLPFTSVTYNISGGGLTFYLPKMMTVSPGYQLEVWLVLILESGNYEYIRANAEVIRMTEGKNGKKSTLSLKYTRIEDRDRQTIIRYCFNRQLRERRQKLS